LLLLLLLSLVVVGGCCWMYVVVIIVFFDVVVVLVVVVYFFSPSFVDSLAVSFEWIWMTMILPTLSTVIASWILAIRYLHLGQIRGR
jgi:hypothetical protein